MTRNQTSVHCLVVLLLVVIVHPSHDLSIQYTIQPSAALRKRLWRFIYDSTFFFVQSGVQTSRAAATEPEDAEVDEEHNESEGLDTLNQQLETKDKVRLLENSRLLTRTYAHTECHTQLT
jgi:hypothetical protein